VLDGVPFGRVLVRFHALTKYLKFTNPWGSGDMSSSGDRRGMDAGTAMFESKRLGVLAPQRDVHVSQLDPALQAIVFDE